MPHFATVKQDGSIVITHLTPEYIAKCAREGRGEADAIAAHVNELRGRGEIAQDDEVLPPNIELPPNREFRSAWCFRGNSGRIDICPHSAAEATKERLRAERAPELAKLDIEFQRAVEENDSGKQAEVAAKKQALRDVTATVPAAPEGMEVADTDYLNSLRAVKLPK
jgi:hypothetical protein